MKAMLKQVSSKRQAEEQAQDKAEEHASNDNMTLL